MRHGLNGFYAEHEHQGNVLTLLLRHLVARAAAAGADPLWVSASRSKIRTLVFYEAYGFRQIGELTTTTGGCERHVVLARCPAVAEVF